jgi:hypothetical protein
MFVGILNCSPIGGYKEFLVKLLLAEGITHHNDLSP